MSWNLTWVPRDQNDEGDSLTHGESSAFGPRRRVCLDWAQIEWCVLPRMMGVAQGIYEQVKKTKGEGGMPKAAGPRPGKSCASGTRGDGVLGNRILACVEGPWPS